MLNVYITVDTEMWLDGPCNGSARLAYDRWIVGRTRQGDYGLPFQLKTLAERGLKACFFVESLSADALGAEPLRDTVQMLTDAGQDIQLHVHPEWRSATAGDCSSVAGEIQSIGDLPVDEQRKLLQRGLDNLLAAGAPPVNAFRAGNYGAADSTLEALAQIGLRYDTSFNPCYVDRECRMTADPANAAPFAQHGIIEIPVASFEDYPGHYRHVQLRACSFAEIRRALLQAVEAGWEHFVIVSHSFELLNSDFTAPDRIVTSRFESLCDFIAGHPTLMRTATFGESPAVDVTRRLTRPSGSVWNTTVRVLEQAYRRVA